MHSYLSFSQDNQDGRLSITFNSIKYGLYGVKLNIHILYTNLNVDIFKWLDLCFL